MDDREGADIYDIHISNANINRIEEDIPHNMMMNISSWTTSKKGLKFWNDLNNEWRKLVDDNPLYSYKLFPQTKEKEDLSENNILISDNKNNDSSSYPKSIRSLSDTRLEKELEARRGDGGSTSYYAVPEGAKMLGDLIRHKNMPHGIGEAFCALYRLNDNGERLRNLKKALYYIQDEIDYLEKD